jgi:renalase
VSAAPVDVVIVGAGMAGLTAARMLVDRGYVVVIIDKGRAAGGRMATRRIGAARFDHGAQHFSARSGAFRAVVDTWKSDGVVAEWFRSASLMRPERGIEPRHIGRDGMRAIAEHLGRTLDIHGATRVERLHVDGSLVVADAGRQSVTARSAIVTAPLPQVHALVDLSGDRRLARQVSSVSYDACLAVMAELDGPSGLREGHAAIEGGPIAWIADNQHKGVSAAPAVTIHSTAAFAQSKLESDPRSWVPELVEAASPLLGSPVSAATGHRWRYSRPRTTLDSGCVVVAGRAPIALAGEVFAGAKVEGAFLSGCAVAEEIAGRLSG